MRENVQMLLFAQILDRPSAAPIRLLGWRGMGEGGSGSGTAHLQTSHEELKTPSRVRLPWPQRVAKHRGNGVRGRFEFRGGWMGVDKRCKRFAEGMKRRYQGRGEGLKRGWWAEKDGRGFGGYECHVSVGPGGMGTRVASRFPITRGMRIVPRTPLTSHPQPG